MGYKLIQNASNIESYTFEVELTEEQYLAYIENPDVFLIDEELNWVQTNEVDSIGPVTYTSSIF
tara:strand:+ start:373 stop:564 length:192 start_codon:yes stop_codon:yes gene_type:complete